MIVLSCWYCFCVGSHLDVIYQKTEKWRLLTFPLQSKFASLVSLSFFNTNECSLWLLFIWLFFFLKNYVYDRQQNRPKKHFSNLLYPEPRQFQLFVAELQGLVSLYQIIERRQPLFLQRTLEYQIKGKKWLSFERRRKKQTRIQPYTKRY